MRFGCLRRARRKIPGRLAAAVLGENDHTVPWSIANASYGKQGKNPDVTEIVKVPGRGHALTIDSGFAEVADIAIKFIRRFVPPAPGQQ